MIASQVTPPPQNYQISHDSARIFAINYRRLVWIVIPGGVKRRIYISVLTAFLIQNQCKVVFKFCLGVYFKSKFVYFSY